MKHLFLINPAAGKSDPTAHFQRAIAQACQGLGLVEGRDFQVFVSEKPGDIQALTRQTGERGQEARIYACGGDGTLNEAVNGAAGFPNLAVTHFPGGSGNDFIKIFNNPQRFEDLSAWMGDPEETVFDLIRCNDRYSLDICSVGLDARIGTDVSRYKRLPLLHGSRAYGVSILMNVLRGIGEPYEIEINGKTLSGEKTMVCVCNGRYYGGGFNPIPDADPTDGVLDVLIVEKVSRLLVPRVIGTYKKGGYARLPQYITRYATDRLTIRAPKPVAINLDGELLVSDKVEISLAQEKVRFFYPRGLTFQAEANRPEAVQMEKV